MREIFESIKLGPLLLVYMFYQYDEDPILFVCKDEAGQLYLCSCCRLGENWVIARTTREKLQELSDNAVTIRDIFEDGAGPVFFVTWNGNQFSANPEVPEEALPKSGVRLCD